MDRPLLFNIEGYIDLVDIAQRHRRNTAHSSFWLRFSKDVAKAYDTHFFRKPDNPDIEFISWEKINDDMIEEYDKKLSEGVVLSDLQPAQPI